MAMNSSYLDLKGRTWDMSVLDSEERRTLDELLVLAGQDTSWNDFDNAWMAAVRNLYRPRGLSGKEMTETGVYRIAQDLSSRIGIRQGYIRPSDYRDKLKEIVRTRFSTCRAFCEATGLSEDMVSHVLARRKHLAIDTLEEALGRIGYTLRLQPAEK